MTVAQVQEFQKSMIANGYISTALGKYQIKQSTLKMLIDQGAISPDDIFDKSTQDRAGLALLKHRGLDRYRSGQMTRDAFADELAKEWAALPLANGNSYYQGQNTNKALTSRGELLDAISAAQGGIARGPKDGYRAILHGTEAVVPLPDGKNIPVALSMPMNMGLPTAEGLSDLNQEVPMAIVNAIRTAMADLKSSQPSSDSGASAAMVSELQNISNLLARQNMTSERILQVARN
jgi:hypothetical protein